MNSNRYDTSAARDPNALLEKTFIKEYLQSQGYTLKDLLVLSEEQVKKLMTEASLYASCKLMEMEARAHFVDEIHGTTAHPAD